MAGDDALNRDEFPWNEGGDAANAYEPTAVTVEVVDPGAPAATG
ncbi:MAG: hypothetical protein ABEJ81_05785 [Haloferacaceae archaeon]